ncbi:helix-turn-helix domain-containing protein [Streptomyces bambusae]|uniref:Helix-turn-helix domain-containing protein n=1 Tax=Streptomyces bambusae TaxID=1550616 RepID=A0ABS6Z225_9ACTN|nr:helix-turn-helix transcriptional regulator [Streptomyces bambusae]MBW5481795.1 helix-turn-helix domain-containing protein [Streptomyces bambusae]
MRQTNRPQRNATWQVIGALQGHLRKNAGYTQERLAEQLNIDAETIASIEQGRRLLQPKLAAQLDELMATGGSLTASLAKVPVRERYPAFVRNYIEHEQEALSLLWYETQVVPGLLQTQDYAAAVIGCVYPPLTAEETEQRLRARLDRQAILNRKPWPPFMHVIIEEAVLHRPVGGQEVLRGQLRHLREAAELPYLGFQVMPTAVGAHHALDGPMILLQTPEHETLAYLEGQRVSYLQDDPDEVHILQLKYGMLRSQALSVERSKGLLDDLLGES